ncbi:MAG: hypothetical protein M3419_10070 [Actinomycetota bacterium]|nr:hypothetical protein [Actinomycetota bacterium]
MRTPHQPVRLTVALTAAALLAGGGAATAGPVADAAFGANPVVTTTTITDPRDTPGPLDIVSVRHVARDRQATATLRYTVTMDQPFEPTDLHRRHRHVVAELDTDGQPGAERNITIYHRDGALRADLISNATRKVISVLHVRHLDGRRLRVRGSREHVGARKIFWYSRYHGLGRKPCGWRDGYPVICQDVAPDSGWVHLPRGFWPPDANH